MAINAANSQAFAQKIVTQVLDTLAKQKDAQQTQRVDGDYQFNPQVFQQTTTLSQDTAGMTPAATRIYLAQRGVLKAHAVMGPVMFTTIFNSPPYVTFGQYAQPLNSTNNSQGIADSQDPFIVQPYVDSWHQTGGQVDGFYLGLYALTMPIAGVTRHKVDWSAYGKGSRYTGRGQQQQGSWTTQFNHAAAGSFLVDSGS